MQTAKNEREEADMSDYDRHCPDCGGDGFHYNDCIYDGTEGYGGYSSGRRSGGSNGSGGKFWILYILALVIGYGINELLGTIIMIGLIIWVAVTR